MILEIFESTETFTYLGSGPLGSTNCPTTPGSNNHVPWKGFSRAMKCHSKWSGSRKERGHLNWNWIDFDYKGHEMKVSWIDSSFRLSSDILAQVPPLTSHNSVYDIQRNQCGSTPKATKLRQLVQHTPGPCRLQGFNCHYGEVGLQPGPAGKTKSFPKAMFCANQHAYAPGCQLSKTTCVRLMG